MHNAWTEKLSNIYAWSELRLQKEEQLTPLVTRTEDLCQHS